MLQNFATNIFYILRLTEKKKPFFFFIKPQSLPLNNLRVVEMTPKNKKGEKKQPTGLTATTCVNTN